MCTPILFQWLACHLLFPPGSPTTSFWSQCREKYTGGRALLLKCARHLLRPQIQSNYLLPPCSYNFSSPSPLTGPLTAKQSWVPVPKLLLFPAAQGDFNHPSRLESNLSLPWKPRHFPLPFLNYCFRASHSVSPCHLLPPIDSKLFEVQVQVINFPLAPSFPHTSGVTALQVAEGKPPPLFEDVTSISKKG